MLDKEFIKRKIKLIEEDLGELSKFKNYSLDDLAKDAVKFYASERLLERIIIRAIDINRYLVEELGMGLEKVRKYHDVFIVLKESNIYPADFAEKMGAMADFRNELVHEYNGLDKEKVYMKIKEVLNCFTKYCDYIIKFLKKAGGKGKGVEYNG